MKKINRGQVIFILLFMLFGLLKKILAGPDEDFKDEDGMIYRRVYSSFEVFLCALMAYYCEFIEYPIKKFLTKLVLILAILSAFNVFFGWLAYLEVYHVSLYTAFRMNFDIVFAINSPYHYHLTLPLLWFGIFETYTAVYGFTTLFGIYVAYRKGGWQSEIKERKRRVKELELYYFFKNVYSINVGVNAIVIKPFKEMLEKSSPGERKEFEEAWPEMKEFIVNEIYKSARRYSKPSARKEVAKIDSEKKDRFIKYLVAGCFADVRPKGVSYRQRQR